jgi:hypothetical protein
MSAAELAHILRGLKHVNGQQRRDGGELLAVARDHGGSSQ